MTTETSIYEYAKQGLALSTDKTAIWFYGKSIAYRELFEKIDNVADNLYAMGVREGTVVTIHLPNCPQAVMAIYAVAKLGGICNMVHALMPREGLKDNMAFTESYFLITYKSDCLGIAKDEIFVDLSYHMSLIYKIGFRLKSKDKCRKGTKPFGIFENTAKTKAAIPDQTKLAGKCVGYFSSSGTTGDPKTVMHCHRAINNWVENAQIFFKKSTMSGESLLSVLPLFHGSGFGMDMHQLITGGGTLVQMAQWNSKLAAKLIKKRRINYITGVPRLYQMLLNESGFDGTSLFQCYVSGDNVGKELKLLFNKRVNKEKCLFEGYGMTEIVTACFSCGVDHSFVEASGYPLHDCEIAVLNDGIVCSHGNGELLVKTNTMMLGYLKDEKTTKAVMTEDGWLRTGDYGRIDEEGYVYYIERIKNTIIHNGYDIFPSEVEALTKSVVGVLDACVVGAFSDETRTQSVNAFVVPQNNENIEELKLRIESKWREKLPKYSVPENLIFLDDFPRNQMAKVDRRKLESMI